MFWARRLLDLRHREDVKKQATVSAAFTPTTYQPLQRKW